MSTNPITSQAEADKAMAYLVKETAKRLKIPKDEAIRRLDGLYKSGVLEGGNPESPAHQMAIDAFLSISSSSYAHLK